MTSRQIRTAIWLTLGTLASGIAAAQGVKSGFVLLIPISYGVALLASNQAYLRNSFSRLLPIYFLLIFLYGSLWLGQGAVLWVESKDEILLWSYTCPISALLLVTLVVRLCIKEIDIGLSQIVFIFLLPIIIVSLIVSIGNWKSFSQNFSNGNSMMILTVLHQICMSVIIISAMKKDNIDLEKRLSFWQPY